MSTPNHSLENSVWPGHGPDQIQRRLTINNYASVIPVLCRRGWVSFSSISFPVVPDISESSSSIDASASTFPSTTSEPPNSAITASCILWLAARKLPREMVGNPCEVLELGCVFLWRSRWKRHMMTAERLHMLSRHLLDLTLNSPVLNRCENRIKGRLTFELVIQQCNTYLHVTYSQNLVCLVSQSMNVNVLTYW